MFQKLKKCLLGTITFIVLLNVAGCAQMIADTLYKDRYAKPATVSRNIKAHSAKTAMKAAVAAANKQGWTPKTISAETNYILAEQVPDVKYTRGARDYTYKLQVQLPENGNGEVSATVTPPTGVVGKPSEEIASEFLVALISELAKKQK